MRSSRRILIVHDAEVPARSIELILPSLGYGLAGSFVYDPAALGGIHIGVSTDITPLKTAEERLQVALRGKDALLHEVHHRIKNNLQVVISLLSLQAGAIKDPSVRVIFEESRNRISTMSLVHQILYQSGDVEHLDFPNFLGPLCDSLADTYGVAQRVQLVRDVQSICLDVDRGIVCGLIVNELVSNAFKHAFPEQRRGMIEVRAWQLENEIGLSVTDDGVGLPADFDLVNSSSMGLHLVQILTEQLYGKLSIESTRGTRFQIQFNLV